jgi:hypothetical protein
LVGSAFAQTTPFFVVQESATFNQTGPTTTVLKGYEFFGEAGSNDFVTPLPADDIGTLQIPSALGTVSMPPAGVELQFDSGNLDQATFQSEFPTGIYTFDLSGSEPAHQPMNVDVNIASGSVTVPTLTAASFNALQGMDPTQDMPVDFNAFSGDEIEFAVLDSSDNVLFSEFVAGTEDTIPANLLAAGEQYRLALVFVNVETPTDGNGTELDDNGQILLVSQGNTIFTTLPEPASALIGMLGIGAWCGLSRRSRQR